MLQARFEKRYAGFALRVDIAAENGTMALLGASGAGKTMTLKCLAGVVKPDKGQIVVDGQIWFDSARRIDLRPQERGVGLLFQNYALFPNMTVRQNLLCGLMHGTPRKSRGAEAERLLAAFSLQGLGERLPAQLSGGQQQRVALARCLARKPQLLLLDEPFAALDAHLRWRLMQDLGETLAAFSGTALYVTHDRDETLTLCDSVCVMHGGRTQPAVSAQDWYQRPQTTYAAHLAGFENVLDVVADGAGSATLHGCGAVWPNAPKGSAALAFRAADVRLAAQQRELAIRCRIVRVSALETVLTPVTGAGILLRAPAQATYGEGSEVWLCVPPECVLWLKREET